MKQNNCQGCGCINKDQCICMKEEVIKPPFCEECGRDCGCSTRDKTSPITSQYVYTKEELINIMKEEYEDKFITYHPAGVDITFNSWEEYNKYKVYENKIRKEYCDDAYKTGVKYVMALKQKVIKSQNKTETVEYPEKKDNPTTYVNVEVQVKVDSVAEFIDIWDVLYPREKQ